MSTSERMEPAPENLSPEGAVLAAKIDAVLDALTDFAEKQGEVNRTVIERLDRVEHRLDQVERRLDQIDRRFEEVDRRFEQMDRRFEEVDRRFEQMDRRFERMDRRIERMDRHLGYLRGAHAADAARRNASLIADDMGYQVIVALPREELIGFAKMARDGGKPSGEVDSFRNADLVMLVRDDKGHPAYIAVEASFTVESRDISRTKRNAEYLHEFTGLPARGAVAGVEISAGRQRNADADGVYCYLIPVKDLQAD